MTRVPPPTREVYFAADVETDGPIPGPFSMLSFALVEVATFDGRTFLPITPGRAFYVELRPISDRFEPAAMAVNGLDRDRLGRDGRDPHAAMNDAARFIADVAGDAIPVLVAYPLAFDWSWLYWYFVSYSATGSPFKHSRSFDLKTAFAVKGRRLLVASGRDRLPPALQATAPHTHHALDDARELGEIFCNVFQWTGE